MVFFLPIALVSSSHTAWTESADHTQKNAMPRIFLLANDDDTQVGLVAFFSGYMAHHDEIV
jgi:hypothetical protein